jgi:hypothetical protein
MTKNKAMVVPEIIIRCISLYYKYFSISDPSDFIRYRRVGLHFGRGIGA